MPPPNTAAPVIGMMICPSPPVFDVQPIQSSNSTAIYLGTASDMADGLPGTQCPIQWVSGSPTTADYIHIPFKLTPIPTHESRVFALLGLMDIPAGVLVRLYGGWDANPTTQLVTTATVEMPNGSVGVWIARNIGAGFGYQYYAWRIYNSLAGETWATANKTVYIGEVFASDCQEWPLARASVKLVDPSKLNRSSGNQTGRVMRLPYRSLEVTIVQQSRAIAFNNNVGTLQDLAYAIANAEYVAVIPFPRDRNSSVTASGNANKLGFLASVVDFGAMESDASKDFWPLQITLEEIPAAGASLRVPGLLF